MVTLKVWNSEQYNCTLGVVTLKVWDSDQYQNSIVQFYRFIPDGVCRDLQLKSKTQKDSNSVTIKQGINQEGRDESPRRRLSIPLSHSSCCGYVFSCTPCCAQLPVCNDSLSFVPPRVTNFNKCIVISRCRGRDCHEKLIVADPIHAVLWI